MQFSPGQLRETVGISVETFRHWKRVLPPFASRKRYTPSFTVGDLLAGKILRLLTEGCGIRVGHLTTVSNELVRLCNADSWASLEQKVVLVDLVRGTCRLSGAKRELDAEDIFLQCALGPMVRELRDALLRSHPAPNQQNLLFRPVAIARERSVRRRVS